MPKITIGEQMVDAFVELGEDIDAIVDEIRHSLDAKDFPTDNAINEAQRCITALGSILRDVRVGQRRRDCELKYVMFSRANKLKKLFARRTVFTESAFALFNPVA